MSFYISSRDRETIERWFDEWLPVSIVDGDERDDFETMWPQVWLMPMWKLEAGKPPYDPDWVTDSRSLGRPHELRCRTGLRALELLDEIRQQLEATGQA